MKKGILAFVSLVLWSNLAGFGILCYFDQHSVASSTSNTTSTSTSTTIYKRSRQLLGHLRLQLSSLQQLPPPMLQRLLLEIGGIALVHHSTAAH